MSVKPISPLRARMVEDMTVRNFVPDTQREYIRAVKKLAAFLKFRHGDPLPAGLSLSSCLLRHSPPVIAD